MYYFLAVVFAWLALVLLLQVFSRIQEYTMNKIVKKQWHWVVLHTDWNSNTLTPQPIDASFAAFNFEAVEYAQQRHAVKPHQTLAAFPCRNDEERNKARALHNAVSARNIEFEQWMTTAAFEPKER